MLPFITKEINNPWGQYELNKWSSNGTQRDRIIYNPQINARFIVEDNNTYSACIKVKSGEYKNFWLVPITRTSFLIIAYVPQLEFLSELAKFQVIKKLLPKFPFLYAIYNMQDSSEGYKIDEHTRIGSSAIIIKVEESLDDLIFPWRGYIENDKIISSYVRLNSIHLKIVSQIEKLYTIAEDTNKREIEAYKTKQKQILKKTLIKTGVKLVALCVAPYAISAIEGVDLLINGMDTFNNISDFSCVDYLDNLLNLGDGFEDFSSSDIFTNNSDYALEIGSLDNSDYLDGSDYNVSFEGSDHPTPSFNTRKQVHIVSENGIDKGHFDVYSQDNKKYIKFFDGRSADWKNWICINDKKYIRYMGVDYKIYK